LTTSGLVVIVARVRDTDSSSPRKIRQSLSLGLLGKFSVFWCCAPPFCTPAETRIVFWNGYSRIRVYRMTTPEWPNKDELTKHRARFLEMRHLPSLAFSPFSAINLFRFCSHLNFFSLVASLLQTLCIRIRRWAICTHFHQSSKGTVRTNDHRFYKSNQT